MPCCSPHIERVLPSLHVSKGGCGVLWYMDRTPSGGIQTGIGKMIASPTYEFKH